MLSVSRAGNTVTITFNTIAGMNYVLEKKDGLADTWGPVAGSNVAGDGTIATVSDPAASASTGFYRVTRQ